MGLDITATETVELVEAMTLDQYNKGGCDKYDVEPWDTSFLFNYDCYKDRGAPLVEGVYRLGGKQHGFRAGSYSGYNYWREKLAAMVGILDLKAFWRSPDMARPFAPLIHFADNKGFIGPEVSERLRRDFEAHAQQAAQFATPASGFAALSADDGRWFIEKFKDWSAAFALAAGRGVVMFY